MKKTYLNLMKSILSILVVVLVVIACKKDVIEPTPTPEPEPEPAKIVVGDCSDFTIGTVNLNSATLDFECSGLTFADSTAYSDANANGTWGRFGDKGVTGSYLALTYANNPSKGGINTSEKVIKVTEKAAIEAWAGFFFNLSEKVNFPSGKEAVSVDIYSAAPGQKVTLKLENKADNTVFKEATYSTTASGAWEKITYNFSAAESGKYDRITMIMNNGVSNSADVVYYFDNIAFTEPVDRGTPNSAASSPTLAAGEVLSIYSDAYTDVTGTDFNPGWGQTTQFSEVEVVSGNKALKYADLNYQGTQFASPLNVKSYNSIHIDYWTSNSTTLNFYLISSGPKETAKALPITTGEWKSIDIPLSDFVAVDLADVIQFKVDGDGTVFFDNIYFWTDPNQVTSTLNLPLDFETANLDYKITNFDGGNLTVVDNPNKSGINTTNKVAKMVKNSGQTWGGAFMTLTSPIDFSTKTQFHMNVHSPKVGAKVLLKVENAGDGAINFEKEVSTTKANEWEDLTFDFSGIDKTKSYQKVVIIFENGTMGDGSSNFTYYLDNIKLQ
ncbi:MAG: hypothetical protein RIR51_192 [Bacteroidota bacterium]|jgi:hypothetical protein